VQIIKRLILMYAILVCQAKSAEYNQPPEALAKSQEITRCLLDLQKNYQNSCDCGEQLTQAIHFLAKENDDICGIAKRFNLSEILKKQDLDYVQSYIDFMHDMTEKLKSFLRSFQEFSAAEKLAFSPFYYHSQADWGTFPNPTRPQSTNFCTYLYRLFVTPRYNFDSVCVALHYLKISLESFESLQKKKEHAFSSLESAIAGIGVGANRYVQTYETMTTKHITVYRENINPSGAIWQAILAELEKGTQRRSLFHGENILKKVNQWRLEAVSF